MLSSRFKAAAALACLLFLASCSQTHQASPKGETETAKPAAPGGPVSGKTAFWEMYKSAHAWATDLVPLTLESKTITGVKNEPGKAAMWTATFGSPRKHEARTFTYAVAAQPPDIAKGISVGRGLSWSGPTQSALPFNTSDFSVDSDGAYQTALAQAQAAEWVKRHPGKDPSLAMGNASRFDGPVWLVHWGDQKSGYAVYVSAKSGAVVK
ncbi:MAG TPA: hypothetical protein VNB54_14685 [Alphaproteobacteria bacterium]|nr:hypothetical protein [Alphaproteobacteria bacterium]